MFFEKLLYLFYAVAAADGRIRPQEIAVLQKAVKKYWFADESVPWREAQVLDTFHRLFKQGVTAAQAFQTFREYYQEHPSSFNKETKSKIAETAAEVAAAFAGNNKSELTLLAQLYLLMHP